MLINFLLFILTILISYTIYELLIVNYYIVKVEKDENGNNIVYYLSNSNIITNYYTLDKKYAKKFYCLQRNELNSLCDDTLYFVNKTDIKLIENNLYLWL